MESRAIEVAGNKITYHVTASESDGAVGVIEYETAPGPMPSMTHWHTREAWTMLVLDGRIHIRLADGERDLVAGESVHVPPRRAFSWTNALEGRSRLLFVYT